MRKVVASVSRGILSGTSLAESSMPTLHSLIQSQFAGDALEAEAFVALADLVGHLLAAGTNPEQVLIPLQTEVRVIKPTFGGLLRSLRTQKKLSQEALASKIGVPVGSVTQWETGRRHPAFKTVVKIARALKVDVNVFADCDLDGDESVSNDKS